MHFCSLLCIGGIFPDYFFSRLGLLQAKSLLDDIISVGVVPGFTAVEAALG